MRYFSAMTRNRQFRRICYFGNGKRTPLQTRLYTYGWLICILVVILWGYIIFCNPVQRFSLSYQLSMTDALSPLPVSAKEPRIILFWVPFFSAPDYYFGFGQEPFLRQLCSTTNCMTTSDRSLLPRAHAIVFHIRNINAFDLPAFRHPDQRWIFFLYEPPPVTMVDLRQFRNMFNWTMTYRRDSDVPSNFTYRTKPASVDPSQKPASRNKTKLVAWIVSNCRPYSRRDQYVRELRHYVPIDIYGACGEETSDYCSPSVPLDKCLQNLEKDYKFYLAFENAVCKDYVTEKWLESVRYDMVPVVYGGANYSSFAPPHSYINVLDFPSPRHLAEHLVMLDHNDHLYRDYLSWKESYQVVFGSVSWCQLCAKLNDPSEPIKVYEDVHQYWVEDGECSTALQLPEMGQSQLQRHVQYLTDRFVQRFNTFWYKSRSLVKYWFGHEVGT